MKKFVFALLVIFIVGVAIGYFVPLVHADGNMTIHYTTGQMKAWEADNIPNMTPEESMQNWWDVITNRCMNKVVLKDSNLNPVKMTKEEKEAKVVEINPEKKIDNVKIRTIK